MENCRRKHMENSGRKHMESRRRKNIEWRGAVCQKDSNGELHPK